MFSGFLGTLITLEWVVALGKQWLLIFPLICGLRGLSLVVGVPGILGPVLLTLGSLGLIFIFTHILRQHTVSFTIVMGLGALSWFIGNLLWISGKPIYQIILWWVGFLVLTIVGERLELGRIARLSPYSLRIFISATMIFLLGLLITLISLNLGARISGFGLLVYAIWLGRFDIARRTVKQTGLTRYIAVCLLSGYIWLGIAGLTMLGYGLVPAGPIYDAFLHAIFVGFVLSMICGHALIIFPAVLNLSIEYQPFLYLPLTLLQTSLIVRFIGGLTTTTWARQWGGLFNAISLVIYLVTIAPIKSFRRISN